MKLMGGGAEILPQMAPALSRLTALPSGRLDEVGSEFEPTGPAVVEMI